MAKRSNTLSISNPVFRSFALGSSLLLVKVLGLGVGTVGVRLWTNTYGFKEDQFFPWFLNLVSGNRWAPVKTVDGKKAVDVIVSESSGKNHAAVKKMNACYNNDIANTPVLVLLGLLYVTVAKPNAKFASYLFGTLVASRYAHTLSFLAGVQPFRALSFLGGVSCGVVMGYEVLKELLFA
ncbi:Microsomal glutathione S-transferase 1 [Chytridiales sp. JEL 0842]|nr:Microsomal glutathione S-transferase 1 [Chytridiales sp. JEL 0842]